jgi:two-component system NarL family sensor kinase
MRPRVAPRVAVCQRKASSSPPVQPDDHQPQPKVVPFQPRPVLSLRFRETNPRRLITNADQIITDANGSAFLGLQVNRPNNIDQGSGDVLCWLQARTSDLLQASLDSLSAHVVILDRTGTVVASNLAWQRFAAAGDLTGSPTHGRPSDLSLCDRWMSSYPQAHAIKKELASVLTGRRNSMRQICSLQAETGVRWFELRASRLDCGQQTHVLVVSEDITAIKEAEQALGEAAEKLLSLQEEERQRISEELHDSTAQHLAAAGLNLMGLRSRVDARGELLELLERIESSLDEASKELRSLTYLLHPPCLEADGLEATLHRYVAGFGKRTGVKARLRIGQRTEALPFVLQRPVFRVIQEALANVYRHASASRVSIHLKFLLGHLHVVVRDNGRGMKGVRRPAHQPCEPSCLGVGIPGIRARLRQFGGRLVIKSGRRGTMLHASVPIAAIPAPGV